MEVLDGRDQEECSCYNENTVEFNVSPPRNLQSCAKLTKKPVFCFIIIWLSRETHFSSTLDTNCNPVDAYMSGNHPVSHKITFPYN